MSNWKIMLLAGAMTLVPMPAFAQDGEAPAAEPISAQEPTEEEMAAAMAKEMKAVQQKVMDEMIAMFGKLFDTSDLPPIDAARLQPATVTAAKLLPDGTMVRIMENMVGTFMKAFASMPDSFTDRRLAMTTGVDAEKVAALEPAKKEAIADLLDPHRKARAEQVSAVVMPFFKQVFAELEPPMREGLARAYARKFSAGQLGEINIFFATPAGGQFAGESFALQADREVMSSLFKAIPTMLPKMIEKGAAMGKDVKALPKERALADLSKDELAKLAGLLGVPVLQLEEQRDLHSIDTAIAVEEAATTDWGTADAAADAAAAAAAAMDAGGEIGDWSYPENWTAEDRERVAQLQEASTAASTALIEAEQAAIERARIRMGGEQPATPDSE